MSDVKKSENEEPIIAPVPVAPMWVSVAFPMPKVELPAASLVPTTTPAPKRKDPPTSPTFGGSRIQAVITTAPLGKKKEEEAKLNREVKEAGPVMFQRNPQSMIGKIHDRGDASQGGFQRFAQGTSKAPNASVAFAATLTTAAKSFDSTSSSEPQQPAKSKCDANHNDNNLYVQYLPADVTVPDLRELFNSELADSPSSSATPPVCSAVIMMDLEKNRSKGYGFVLVSSAAVAQAAISKLNGFAWRGKKLLVRLAEKSPTQVASEGPKAPSSKRGRKKAPQFAGKVFAPVKPAASREPSSDLDLLRDRKNPEDAVPSQTMFAQILEGDSHKVKQGGDEEADADEDPAVAWRNIYVKGLPVPWREHDVQQHFANTYGIVDRVQLFYHLKEGEETLASSKEASSKEAPAPRAKKEDHSRFKGIAKVVFRDSSDALKAIQEGTGKPIDAKLWPDLLIIRYASEAGSKDAASVANAQQQRIKARSSQGNNSVDRKKSEGGPDKSRSGSRRSTSRKPREQKSLRASTEERINGLREVLDGDPSREEKTGQSHIVLDFQASMVDDVLLDRLIAELDVLLSVTEEMDSEAHERVLARRKFSLDIQLKGNGFTESHACRHLVPFYFRHPNVASLDVDANPKFAKLHELMYHEQRRRKGRKANIKAALDPTSATISLAHGAYHDQSWRLDALIERIAVDQRILTVDVSENHLSQGVIDRIVEAVCKNRSIRYFDGSGNNGTPGMAVDKVLKSRAKQDRAMADLRPIVQLASAAGASATSQQTTSRPHSRGTKNQRALTPNSSLGSHMGNSTLSSGVRSPRTLVNGKFSSKIQNGFSSSNMWGAAAAFRPLAPGAATVFPAQMSLPQTQQHTPTFAQQHSTSSWVDSLAGVDSRQLLWSQLR